MGLVMRVLSTATSARANEVDAKNETGKSVASKVETDDCTWFKKPAREMLGTNPGLALHYVTGEPESTCHYAFRGPNGPSLYLYRKLLWADEGERWLNVIMDGCEAEWWTEHQALSTRIEFAERKLAAIGAVISQQLSSRGVGNGA